MSDLPDDTTSPAAPKSCDSDPESAAAKRLREITALEETLEKEKLEIYRASFRAEDPEDVVCEPYMAQMLGGLDDGGEPAGSILASPFIKYPITVEGISYVEDGRQFTPWRPTERAPTPWVSIRPVDEDRFEKAAQEGCPKCFGSGEINGDEGSCGCRFTWLGVNLGDIALSYGLRLRDGILTVGPSRLNPAIWIPEKHEIVFGCASWWGPIKSEKHLRSISGSDVEGVWYVRAAKELFGAGEATP